MVQKYVYILLFKACRNTNLNSPPPLIDFNNINITFYSFHFADEKNFTILSYRGLI